MGDWWRIYSLGSRLPKFMIFWSGNASGMGIAERQDSEDVQKTSRHLFCTQKPWYIRRKTCVEIQKTYGKGHVTYSRNQKTCQRRHVTYSRNQKNCHRCRVHVRRDSEDVLQRWSTCVGMRNSAIEIVATSWHVRTDSTNMSQTLCNTRPDPEDVT